MDARRWTQPCDVLFAGIALVSPRLAWLGQVVGRSQTASGQTHAFRRTAADGMVDLGTLGGTFSVSWGINDFGQIAGLSTTASGAHVFLWTPEEGMIDLGVGLASQEAFAINQRGALIDIAGDASSGRAAIWTLEITPSRVGVAIDIKPGSDPNSINRRSRGSVPVALLSSETFDATTADRSTVVFADAPALERGGGLEDVNNDGLVDLVFHFATQELNLPDGSTEACLTGQTTSGARFKGCDAVRLVK